MVSQIDAQWEPLESRACLAWALVHRVRQWRVKWLLRRGAGERHVCGSLSAWFVQLQAAAFRRVFPVTLDPVRVASAAEGPFGYVAGWDERVYRALRAPGESWGMERGGGSGGVRWRRGRSRNRRSACEHGGRVDRSANWFIQLTGS